MDVFRCGTLALMLVVPLSISGLASAQTSPAKSEAAPSAAKDTNKDAAKGTETASSEKSKPTKAQLEAMLTKCSEEADAKGLLVKAGKGAARKEFRRECMRKMGVTPK